MTFNFIYEPMYYPQVIFSVMVDSRKGTSLANQTGVVIKAAVDEQVELVTDDVLFYKIETEEGVLCGYVSLSVTNSAQTVTKLQQVIRPAYQQFVAQINQSIDNWINLGGWRSDYLI